MKTPCAPTHEFSDGHGIPVARAVLCLALVLIAAGLATALVGASPVSAWLLSGACGVLLTGPILNVLAELVGEVRRRDWPFVGAAAVVLALIAYTAVRTIW